MGYFLRNTAIFTITGVAAFAAYSQSVVYVGPYIEKNSFDYKRLSTWNKLKYNLIGTNDDVGLSKSAKVINPHHNKPSYDYYEQSIDPETSQKILAKYKSNEEILTQIQKGCFLGPTLFVHRFLLSPYFKSKGDNNRIAGFTKNEPELNKLNLDKAPRTAIFNFPLLPKSDKLNYVWSGNELTNSEKLLPKSSVVYGLFDVLDYGENSHNGGFYDVAFGSDLLGLSAVHRLEYEVRENQKKQQYIVVRLINFNVNTFPNSPAPKDETKGLHEFMTRTLVQDVVRALARSV